MPTQMLASQDPQLSGSTCGRAEGMAAANCRQSQGNYKHVNQHALHFCCLHMAASRSRVTDVPKRVSQPQTNAFCATWAMQGGASARTSLQSLFRKLTAFATWYSPMAMYSSLQPARSSVTALHSPGGGLPATALTSQAQQRD